MYEQARKAIEMLYDSTCTINRLDKKKNPVTKAMDSKSVEKYKDEPCRVSKQSLSKNDQTDVENKVSYQLKLFIAPEIDIRQGDEIVVTKRKVITVYKAGVGAPYDTHQEVILSLDGKA